MFGKYVPTNCLMVLLVLLPYSDGACTIPEVLQRSTWKDSDRGEVTFTTWNMAGWSFRVNGQTVGEWVVVDNTKFNGSAGGYIAYRSLETFTDRRNITWYSYLCLKYKKMTNFSYQYYQYHGAAEQAEGERVKLHEDDSLSSFEDICDESFTPSARQFHIMIKKGKEAESHLDCPDAILGRFDYTLHLKNGSALCAASKDNWDGCKDTKRIRFNYTSCSAIMLYSAVGELQCVGSTVVSVFHKQYTNVIVLNLDSHSSIDNVVTVPFACISASSDGEDMSVVPGSCTPTQDPYNFPENADGTRVSNGVKITNKVLETCRHGDQDNDGKGGNNLSMWTIIGLACGGVVLTVIIVISIVIHVRRRCKRAQSKR